MRIEAFEVRITSREPSYGIVDGVYKLHVIVDDAPENKPIFEKYIYTLPLQGEGTSNKPYLITCADDLIAIREAVADGNAFVGQYFQFEKDVTLPDGWQPIGCTKDGSDRIDSGSNLNAFSGIINGAGHTLTVPVGGLPLLGYVWGATVRDLNIYGTQIAGYGLVNNYHGVGLNGTAMRSRGYGTSKRTSFMIYRMTGLDVGLLAALVVLFLLAVFVGDKTANFTPVMDIAKIDGWNSLGLVAYAAFLLLPTALHIKEAIQWHISRSRI